MKRLLSILLALVVSVSDLSLVASAKTVVRCGTVAPEVPYPVITALGDSASSGFGLPDYQRRGELVLFGERIENSYPDLVAKELGAETLYPYGVSGIRSADLRFLLDPDYAPDAILKKNMGIFSEGWITPEHLEELRPAYQKAVEDADLILLDIGFDDIWIPTIATIYNIAEYGRPKNYNYEETVRQKVEQYGSTKVVLQNAWAYLKGFALHPTQWVSFWVQWDTAVLKFLTDFTVNYEAIVKRIYQFNPDVTVVALGSYNPCAGWSLLVGDQSIEHVIQPYYDLLNAEKGKLTTLYPNYHYVSVRDIDMINNRRTLPLYENITLDESGFNPHPTEAGHRTIADLILKELQK